MFPCHLGKVGESGTQNHHHLLPTYASPDVCDTRNRPCVSRQPAYLLGACLPPVQCCVVRHHWLLPARSGSFVTELDYRTSAASTGDKCDDTHQRQAVGKQERKQGLTHSLGLPAAGPEPDLGLDATSSSVSRLIPSPFPTARRPAHIHLVQGEGAVVEVTNWRHLLQHCFFQRPCILQHFAQQRG